MLSIRSRYDGTVKEVVDSFCDQNNVFKLSVFDSTVRSRTSKRYATDSCCKIPPTNSRSEFVMELLGYLSMMSSHVTNLGHLRHQITGDPVNGDQLTAVELGKKNPPAPIPEAL